MTTAVTREVFGQTLLELGSQDPKIVVLGGDLNKSTFAYRFGQQFPDRFFDLGPAEQNMMSMAAGFASCGKTVFVSTFAVFGTGRPFDQIRVGIAQPRANVKIVCTHAGIVTGEDGISAQGIEDLALMGALPGLTVIVPADGPETDQAARVAAREPGPFYIRLSRPATPIVHQPGFTFRLGKAETLREGNDVAIIACGIMVPAALQAAERLAPQGIQCRVINMATLQPLDEQGIAQAAAETGAIVTAEEHYRHGGLGSLVAQTIGRTLPVPMESVALDRYAESGKPELLLAKYGLTAADVEKAAVRAIGRKRR
ncbi:MAG: transketolase family protein [Chloroflexi bacterium]|nr:transketolase family protein [Chloroflexota bacterium]